MSCWRLFIAGSVLMLVGCGAPRTPSPAVSAESTPPVAAESTPSALDRQQLAALQNQLRQARKNIEDQYRAHPTLAENCFKPPFPILAPVDLAGYAAEPLEAFDLREHGAAVRVRLVDRGDSRRWVELWQGMGCYGAMAGPPQDATDIEEAHPVNVPGLAGDPASARLQAWKEADGSSTVWLIWYSNAISSPNTMYQLTGHNISKETVIRIATTMRPVE